MITKAELMPLLCAAAPSFVPEPMFDDLLYPQLGHLAHHLVERLQEDDFSEFPAVFAVVERLHLEGDHEVREAATIGLLEAIQNSSGGASIDSARFLPHLGPESTRWWHELNRFWMGESKFVGAGLAKK